MFSTALFIDQRTHQRSSSSGSPMRICRYAAISASVIFARCPRCKNNRRMRSAALPRRSHRAEKHRPHHQIEIGIVHHDHAVVAAQLQQRASQASRRPTSADVRPIRVEPVALISGMRRSSNHALADHVVAPMTRLQNAVPSMPREHAHRRCAAPRCAVSGVLSDGFQITRIAADHRDQRVPAPHRDWKIERRDHADRAERMPLLVHAMPGPFARAW